MTAFVVSAGVRAGPCRGHRTTSTTWLDGPKVDLNRVRMTLTRTGGQWLVSAVDAL